MKHRGVKPSLGEAFRDTFRSVGVRNFRLFFGGQVISQVGNWMTLVTQTLLVLSLTHNSGVAVGVLAACQFGPLLLIGAWAGLIADRSDKRKLLIIVQALAMVQSFMLAGLALLGHPPVLAIFAVATLGGFTVAFDQPTRRAFVSELVPPDHVQNAVSINTALMTASRIFGPALAGLVVVLGGYSMAFAIDGFSYIAVIVGLWFIRTHELHLPPQAVKAKGQIRAGLHYVASVPELWIPMAMMAVIGTLSFNFQVVMPLFVYETFGGSTTQFTLLFSTVSVGAVIGALAGARKVTVSVLYMSVTAVLFGVALVVLGASPTLALAYPLAALMGGASVLFSTAASSMVQLRSSARMRGRVLALQSMVFLGSTPVGGPLVGWVSDAMGPRAGIYLGGLAGVVAGIGGWILYRRYRQPGDPVDLSPGRGEILEPVDPTDPISLQGA